MRRLNSVDVAFVMFSITSILFVSLVENYLLLLSVLPMLFVMLSKFEYSRSGKKLFEFIPLFVFLITLTVHLDLFLVLTILLLTSMGAKYIISTTPSDYFEIFLIGIMLSILSSIGTISFAFGIIGVVFLISSFLFLFLTQFRSKESLIFINKNLPDTLEIAEFFAISLALTVALFYLMPRFSFGVIQGNPITNKSISNFSTDVSIDSRPLELDYTIVMRIEKERGEPVYISGLRYATFLHDRWYKDEETTYVYPDVGENFLETSLKRATIFLEPNNTNVIFRVESGKGIHGKFSYILKDNLSNLYFNMPFFKTIKYDSYYLNEPEKVTLNEKEKAMYLDLRGISSQVIDLSRSITEGSPKEEQKVVALVNYLKRNNQYSLTPTAKNIEDFIMNHKSGYCEHFATAFVILSRASNIPARLVSGFVTSEWNDTLHYYIVRAKDAHTWAEVYINGTWVRVDPTPQIKTTVSNFSIFLETIRMFWYKGVITYNAESQIETFSSISTALKDFGNRVFEILHLIQNHLFLLLGGSLLLSAYFLLRRREKNDYLALKIIELIGGERHQSETLLEFAKRRNKYEELKELITLYYNYRFAKRLELGNEILRLIRVFKGQK